MVYRGSLRKFTDRIKFEIPAPALGYHTRTLLGKLIHSVIYSVDCLVILVVKLKPLEVNNMDFLLIIPFES